MKRRYLVAALPAFAFLLGACARSAHAQPSHSVSLAQLERVLAQRFPLRYAASGLVEVEWRVPQLRLLPEQNRIGAVLPLEAAGPALRHAYAGSVDVDFALRYEASDRTLRAHQIRIHAVQVDGLRPDLARLLDGYLRRQSEQAVLEVVLHRLRPQDLALAATMGFEPGEVIVTPRGLTLRFIPCGASSPCAR